MIAILPPTSPTTVMGGFSLGISTDQWQFFFIFFFTEAEKKRKKKVYTIYFKRGNVNFAWVTTVLARSEVTTVPTITVLLGKAPRF